MAVRTGRAPLLWALAIGSVLSLLAAVWFSPDASLRRVRAAGLLRVGYAVEAPYAWVGADGNVTGESPESARRIAARLGLTRLEWVQVSFDELIPGLRERRFDLIAAGLFVTPARQQLVRFSDPTVRVMPGLLVARGNPRAVHGYRDALRPDGVRIAALSGSVEQSRLQALGVPAARLMVVPDATSGRAAVASGSAAALALSLPSLRQMARDLPGTFEVEPEADARGDLVAFAFHPDDEALQRAWNEAQSGWVGSDEQRRLLSALGVPAGDLVPGAPP